MSLKLLQKLASDFTPNAGSNISFDSDHLKCDDYLESVSVGVGTQHICRNLNNNEIYMRPGGGAPSAIWKIAEDLSGAWTQINLSDGDATWCCGLGADDDGNFYKVSHNSVNVKKYNNLGTWQWTSAFSAYGGCMYYAGTNHVYICDRPNHRVREIDKNGAVIHDHLLTGDNASAQLPEGIWVDSSGIYILTFYGLITYDLSWNYQSWVALSNTAYFTERWNWYGSTLLKRDSGSFIASAGAYAYGGLDGGAFEFDDTGKLLKPLIAYGVNGNKGESKLGSSAGSNICFNANSDGMYAVTQGSLTVILMDIRDSSERYATLSHDFGSSVNITRLNINALYDNRDESWKSMRLWYQIDGGGYVEVDLKNPLLDINGQVLDLKLGMTSYGFLRNWPELYSVDIIYDDGQTPAYKSHLVANIENKSSLTAKIQNKNKITVRLRNEP